jgi:iron(III) transport system ATP-binding protein
VNLKIQQLNFRYQSREPKVFSDFNLEVQEGSTLAILGKSGSGKSTLLRIISGLEERAEGIIQMGDQIVQDQRNFIPVEKRRIGFVFQDYALFPFMTVAQNIAFGMKKPEAGKVAEMLNLTQLEGLEKRYPHELSGGQQQRTALARTLAAEPGLLLMDEPFSNLDTALVSELRMDLKRIIRTRNMTTLMVTHNLEDALALADQTLTLS